MRRLIRNVLLLPLTHDQSMAVVRFSCPLFGCKYINSMKIKNSIVTGVE